MTKIDELLHDVKTVVIGGHVRPDGDCIGSSLAVYGYIKENYPDISVDVYLEAFDEKFMIMPYTDEAKKLEKTPSYKNVDLFISVDCGDKERLGFLVPVFDQAKKTCCIDHHISNYGYGDENVIDGSSSATCELLCELFDMSKVSLDCAKLLLMGIVHDTGTFKHSNVTEKTLITAASLVAKGAKTDVIINETLACSTYRQQQVIGRALLKSVLFFHGKCIVSDISNSEMKFYGVTGSDLGAIVDMLRSTRGVEVAIFMYEISPLTYRVSLRSNYVVDVNKVAVHFGGGGHVRAAGCTMRGTRYDVIRNLSDELAKQLAE